MEGKRITLTQGQFAVVDDVDYERITQWKRSAFKRSDGNGFYAVRSEWPSKRTIFLHRQIMGLQPGDGILCDHENGDTLDCRRFNLRCASPRQNSANRKRSRANTSGYKSVSYCRKLERWKASIWINRRSRHLGYYSDPLLASAAYRDAAIQEYGEFARTQ